MSKRNTLTLETAARHLNISVDELSLMLEPGVTSLTVDELEHLVAEVAAKKNQSLVVSNQNTLPKESVQEVAGNVADYVDAGFPLPALDVVAARAFFDQYRQRQAQELGKLSADAVYDLQEQEQVLAAEANDQRNAEYLKELKDSTEKLQSKTEQLFLVRRKEREMVAGNMQDLIDELPLSTRQLLHDSALYSHLFTKKEE